MPELKKGLSEVFEFLRAHEKGEIINRAAILKATGWKESTLKTYLSKNKFATFLAQRADGKFEVLRKGSTLKTEDIANALTQVTPDTTRFNPGEKVTGKFAKYVLIEEIGRGATAHVWFAKKVRTEEQVAIKIVNPRADLLKPSIFSNLRQRFAREASNGSKLEHDCIVKHLDHGAHRGMPFLVMKRAARSLKVALETEGRLLPKTADEAITRCARGLKYLHDKSSIHRDIKPANMLATERGVVLGDLGIVKWSDLNPEFTNAGTITTDAVRLGSLNYMAPEQQDAPHEVREPCDVYALGVSWYELLTNTLPSHSAFTNGKTKAPSGDAKRNAMIRAMTQYDQEQRPSIDDVLRFLGVEPEDFAGTVSEQGGGA